jgi:hypothetical protein
LVLDLALCPTQLAGLHVRVSPRRADWDGVSVGRRRGRSDVRTESGLTLPANSNRAVSELPRKAVSLKASLRKGFSQPVDLTAEQAGILAAEVLDEALIMSGIGTEQAALTIGVSTGMVSKWRSATYRERPSYAQLLQLPPEFHLAMNRIVSRRFGFARAALAMLMDAAGDLAVAIGE